MTPNDDATFPQEEDAAHDASCHALDELYTEGIVTDDGDVIDLVNPNQDE